LALIFELQQMFNKWPAKWSKNDQQNSLKMTSILLVTLGFLT
jgi:hypothetical protein